MEKEKIKRVCPVCSKVHTYPCKKGYCIKHYTQLLRYGKFLDNSPRSIYDDNEFQTDGDITYISVYDKNGVELPEKVIIDTKNIPGILKYKVYTRLLKKGNISYAYCNISRNNKIPIHRMVLPTSKTVDHINGNTLDNRECNLREADMTVQNLNKPTTKGIQKSIVTRNGQLMVKGYAATLGYNKKRYISKYYASENEAKYYRYLLLQLLPFKTNYDMSFMKELTEEQKSIINKDFENRFKNRVL